MGRRPPKPPTPAELAEVFRSHAAGLAGAVRGVLGAGADEQEVLQEAFLRACRALERGSRPRDPAAWVFVVSLNLARDLARRQRGRNVERSLGEVDAATLGDGRAGPGARLEQDEAVAAARSAIGGLRDAEKEVFLLRVSGGLTFDAIAEALSIPIGTAKTRMRSALGSLRQELGDFAPDGPGDARSTLRGGTR